MTPFSNGLKSVAVLAKDRPHGDRLRYMAGCKCMLCRAANSNYETGRAAARKAGDWNGVVAAGRARVRLRKLARKGIGLRAVSAVSGIPRSTLFAIKSGRKRRIRARTERKILAVEVRSARGDGTLIDATRTWALIRTLVDTEGFSTKYIATMLGYSRPYLQIKKTRVIARTEMRVQKLYDRLVEPFL